MQTPFAHTLFISAIGIIQPFLHRSAQMQSCRARCSFSCFYANRTVCVHREILRRILLFISRINTLRAYIYRRIGGQNKKCIVIYCGYDNHVDLKLANLLMKRRRALDRSEFIIYASQAIMMRGAIKCIAWFSVGH